MAPKMAPKKATKQSSITSMGFPLLQKPAETCVGRQIQVLGSYWTGRMSTEEANSLYKCTVRDFHALHKWDAGGTPSQAMELQEMGVDGQGNRETGGSSADRIFFMKYPLPSLQHWYATYPPPQQDTTPFCLIPSTSRTQLNTENNAPVLKISCFCMTSKRTIVTRMRGWR